MDALTFFFLSKFIDFTSELNDFAMAATLDDSMTLVVDLPLTGDLECDLTSDSCAFKKLFNESPTTIVKMGIKVDDFLPRFRKATNSCSQVGGDFGGLVDIVRLSSSLVELTR